MSTILTTHDLEIFIKKNFQVLNAFAQKNEIYCKFDIYFSNGTPNNIEGIYVYSDELGYHYVVTERGKVSLHKITGDLFEISYWIYSGAIFKISLKYATLHKRDNQDFRRILFEKKIEILGLLGNEYRRKGEAEIYEILKNAPYNDNVF